MDVEKKIECLWKTIARLDNYVSWTNNKATIILAFNTFILGGIILKWSTLIEMYGGNKTLESLTYFLLSIGALSSIFSIYKLFEVINPYLFSHSVPEKYHSKIFFDHISQFNSKEEYSAIINDLSYEKQLEDLCYQVHSISLGLDSKYKKLKTAIDTILYLLLPTLSIILFLKIGQVLFHLINVLGA